MEDSKNNTPRIRDQNDLFRIAKLGGKHTDLQGQITITPGIAALPSRTRDELLFSVALFEEFTEDNDPHGEHDFGAFDFQGRKVFWKIDYYAPGLQAGSEDPADPAQTERVLTVMLAEEY